MIPPPPTARSRLRWTSSAFWLGWRAVIGHAATSKTTANLKETRECVLDLPSERQADAVNRLALTTGSDPVPEAKRNRGYRYQNEKFALAGLTAVASEMVQAPRVGECPVQLEAVVAAWRDLAAEDAAVRGRSVIFELRIQRVDLAQAILMDGNPDRVDPDKWRPLIMSFQKYYGLAPGELRPSTLARIPERLYRSPDVDRARMVRLAS